MRFTNQSSEKEELGPQIAGLYPLLLENDNYGILIAAQDGQIMVANQTAVQTLGYNISDLVKLDLERIIDTTEPNHPVVLERRTGEQRLKGHSLLITKHGKQIPVEFCLQFFSGKNGENCTGLIFRDATVREKPREDTGRLATRLQSLNTLGKAILDSRTFEEIGHTALATLIELVPCQHAMVGVINQEAMALSIAASWSQNQSASSENEALAYTSEEYSDLLDAPYILRSGDEYESRLMVGLKNGSALVGILFLDSTRSNFFTEEYLEIVTQVANFLAIGIQTISLHQQIWQQARDLEKKISRRTEELASQNNHLETIFDGITDGVLLVDSARKIRFINRAARNLFKLSESDPVEIPIEELFSPANLKELEESINLAITENNDQRLEVQARRTDASTFVAELKISPVTSLNAVPDGLVFSVQDITSLKKAEEALSKSEERYRSLVENITDMVVRLDPEAVYLDVSPSCEALLGYKPEEMIGRSGFDFIHLDDLPLVIAKSGEALATRRTYSPIMVRFKHKSGHYVWLEISGRTIYAKDTGKPLGFITISRDVSERKRYEESLEKALENERELGELKTRIVSVASHEFRAPLATIMTTTETLKNYRQRMTEEQIDDRINKIMQQVDFMKSITDDVLLLGRLQSGKIEFKPEPGDLDELCQEILEDFRLRLENKAQLVYKGLNRSLVFHFDPRLMRQVISNLVSNSLKYSPDNNPVEVELQQVDNHIILRVIDHGLGISEEDQEHLFESFFRASNVGHIEGTGLGLAITRQGVEMHGGIIEVESKLGSGTTFTVTLPLL